SGERTPRKTGLGAYSGADARPKAGTEQMRAFNDAAGDDADGVLFDDVGLVIFDAFKPVRDVEPVADFLRPRLDDVKLRRVGEPTGDERRRFFGSRALAEAGRNERSKRDAGSEASRDRRRVLSGNRL